MMDTVSSRARRGSNCCELGPSCDSEPSSWLGPTPQPHPHQPHPTLTRPHPHPHQPPPSPTTLAPPPLLQGSNHPSVAACLDALDTPQQPGSTARGTRLEPESSEDVGEAAGGVTPAKLSACFGFGWLEGLCPVAQAGALLASLADRAQDSVTRLATLTALTGLATLHAHAMPLLVWPTQELMSMVSPLCEPSVGASCARAEPLNGATWLYLSPPLCPARPAQACYAAAWQMQAEGAPLGEVCETLGIPTPLGFDPACLRPPAQEAASRAQADAGEIIRAYALAALGGPPAGAPQPPPGPQPLSAPHAAVPLALATPAPATSAGGAASQAGLPRQMQYTAASRWSSEDTALLKELIQAYGLRDWATVIQEGRARGGFVGRSDVRTPALQRQLSLASSCAQHAAVPGLQRPSPEWLVCTPWPRRGLSGTDSGPWSSRAAPTAPGRGRRGRSGSRRELKLRKRGGPRPRVHQRAA